MSADEIADRLYGLPPEEFTAARNQLERELRKAGQREQADQVKALRKPSAAAGAVNRLVRTHRGEVEAFLEAAARLRDAQVAGKGDIAAAARAEGAALQGLVALGGEAVRGTLQAAAVDDEVAGALIQARLVQEPEPAGFGTLLAYTDSSAARPPAAKSGTPKPSKAKPQKSEAVQGSPTRRRPPAPEPPDDSAACARLEDAKTALAAAAAEERQAQRRWTQTQRELEKAQAAVEKAQRELKRLRGS